MGYIFFNQQVNVRTIATDRNTVVQHTCHKLAALPVKVDDLHPDILRIQLLSQSASGPPGTDNQHAVQFARITPYEFLAEFFDFL